MNLHAYMDSMALEQKDNQRLPRPLNDEGKTYLSNLADSIMKEYPPEYFADDVLANLSSHTWTI